ncbi:unnamed protein product, partial [Ectocarpus sp. 8 AP-2014]
KQQPAGILLPLLVADTAAKQKKQLGEWWLQAPRVSLSLEGSRRLPRPWSHNSGRREGSSQLGVQKVSPPPLTVLPRSSVALPGDALLHEVLGRCQREVDVIPPQPQQPIRPKHQPQQPGLRGISGARGHLPELAVDKPSGRARGRRSV